MKITTRNDWLVLRDVAPFSLDRTLKSGQTFRWKEKDGVFEGIVRDTFIQARQEGDALWARTFPVPLQRGLIEDYFSLKYPLAEAVEALEKDGPLADALRTHPGIRILRQEPWECLASFILAINKAIPQIEKTVAALCEMLGEKIDTPGGERRLFPTVAAVARTSEEDLRKTKMGFRAKYLKAAAQRIQKEEIVLVQYRESTYAQARSALMEFYGVGPKVADCVCLFSLDQPEAFPVDVWIARAMQQLYGGRRKMKEKRMHTIAQKRFGRYAGLAQQYLYHHARTCIL